MLGCSHGPVSSVSAWIEISMVRWPWQQLLMFKRSVHLSDRVESIPGIPIARLSLSLSFILLWLRWGLSLGQNIPQPPTLAEAFHGQQCAVACDVSRWMQTWSWGTVAHHRQLHQRVWEFCLGLARSFQELLWEQDNSWHRRHGVAMLVSH